MKKLAVLALVIAAVGYVAIREAGVTSARPETPANADRGSDVLATSFANRSSNVQVQGTGRVTRILSDDRKGSRHQRFVLRLDSGQTLLVAHNIDVAKRIDGLETGDAVEFNGEYEWSAAGGVIHWTHRDPRGKHKAGWLRHEGRTYD